MVTCITRHIYFCQDLICGGYPCYFGWMFIDAGDRARWLRSVRIDRQLKRAPELQMNPRLLLKQATTIIVFFIQQLIYSPFYIWHKLNHDRELSKHVCFNASKEMWAYSSLLCNSFPEVFVCAWGGGGCLIWTLILRIIKGIMKNTHLLLTASSSVSFW